MSGGRIRRGKAQLALQIAPERRVLGNGKDRPEMVLAQLHVAGCFHGDLMGFNGDLMGLYGGLMGF